MVELYVLPCGEYTRSSQPNHPWQITTPIGRYTIVKSQYSILSSIFTVLPLRCAGNSYPLVGRLGMRIDVGMAHAGNVILEIKDKHNFAPRRPVRYAALSEPRLTWLYLARRPAGEGAHLTLIPGHLIDCYYDYQIRKGHLYFIYILQVRETSFKWICLC